VRLSRVGRRKEKRAALLRLSKQNHTLYLKCMRPCVSECVSATMRIGEHRRTGVPSITPDLSIKVYRCVGREEKQSSLASYLI
jgi:hypothetical protein